MISVTPSPPQPSRTAWTSKPCPPCRGTTMPGSPCAPTPTPPGRSKMRQPRPWATSWGKSYKRERQQKTGREGRSSRPVLFCPFRPFRRVGQKFLASPQSDFLQQKNRKPRLNSDKVLFSFARGRERCDRNGHAVFLRPGVDFATTGSEITGISTSSTKLK